MMMGTATAETAAHPSARLSSDGSASAAHPLQRILAEKHAVMESEMWVSNVMMGIR